MFKLNFFKKSRKINTVTEKDVLIELDDNEMNAVKAVGNSIESAKWFLGDDLNYLTNKKMY